ncbi:DegT/DnrJ/EryC1/StrS family aminotransferase [Sphingomonas aerophila]|uniref:dTDP-4-amino-4,6-dideoxygalactose transaminase n=1 Tax=Sphingomonas aerophila TaxID=1344948 RepID=A0A7W9BDL5_9SPHN|nr:DegT/DnrJ/EryC1/StrS family aminotransferase [Sphingomonas aerophila]MBB5715048.1 dTDP-4-amino-4,6-dideoxygalactose transaminase [Sphingomonas aerophila]
MPPLPLIAPQPPRLSELGEALRRVEASGVFSNNGPEVRAFEAEVTERLFGGTGACLAVANATLGLMIAIRDAAGGHPRPGTLALMPALTFAATAQAASWAGLTPLICDVDPDDWSASAAAEEQLLARHGERIGVAVPYATFGNAIDLDRYAWIAQRYRVGVVVDAAASLGTLDERGRGFGTGAPFATVFSMHATKTFAVAEGGLIHSADADCIARLRAMANFGFVEGRSASLPGINAKLPEVLALMARAKLTEIDDVLARRAAVEAAYRDALPGFGVQRPLGMRRASQFMPVLLPAELAPQREAVAAALAVEGIGTGCYFSPHLGQQPEFQATALIEPTPVADRISAALVSLPVTDAMTPDDARRAAGALVAVVEKLSRSTPRIAASGASTSIATTIVIGGGPAGTALLTAATKRNLLPGFAKGLVVVERDAAVGGGRLGRYAITSDSTAQTFLTAVKNNAHPELAALVDHPVGRAVAAYQDALGVPLVEAGPLLRVTGQRLADLTRAHGGEVLTGHEALHATAAGGGLWRVRLRRLSDGQEIDRLARNVVIATGGHQPLDRLSGQSVAGVPLVQLAGDRLLQSDDVLTVGGFDKVADLLSSRRAPRIAVIGGSTSALTTVALLLRGRPALPLGAGGITLLHRRPLRPFYPSVEAAHAEGFHDFGPDDICPVSGFVYRLAGFRLEARELVLRMLGVGGLAPDPRVALHRITGDDDAAARQVLREADLVIAALGYRPFALPVFAQNGAPIPLAAGAGRAMVDRHCRVVGSDDAAVPGLFGIGLAAGFVPWGALGGEKSFVGQANGLWLWQNDVGLMIVDQVLGQRERAAA